jgi:hypothetical protein
MSAELIDAARTTPILPGMSLLSTRQRAKAKNWERVLKDG